MKKSTIIRTVLSENNVLCNKYYIKYNYNNTNKMALLGGQAFSKINETYKYVLLFQYSIDYDKNFVKKNYFVFNKRSAELCDIDYLRLLNKECIEIEEILSKQKEQWK